MTDLKTSFLLNTVIGVQPITPFNPEKKDKTMECYKVRMTVVLNSTTIGLTLGELVKLKIFKTQTR